MLVELEADLLALGDPVEPLDVWVPVVSEAPDDCAVAVSLPVAVGDPEEPVAVLLPPPVEVLFPTPKSQPPQAQKITATEKLRDGEEVSAPQNWSPRAVAVWRSAAVQLASKQFAISCMPVEQKQVMSLGKSGQAWEAQSVIHASGVWAPTRDATTATTDKARNFMVA